MFCPKAVFLILVGTQKGLPVYEKVPEKYLKPEVRALNKPELHEECRKRKIGECLSQIRLNTTNGHITFVCSYSQRADSGKKPKFPNG